MRLAVLTVPLAAIIAWLGVLSFLRHGDTWLALSLIAAAIYILILPASTQPADASSVVPPSTELDPQGDVVEADVVRIFGPRS